MSPLNWRIPTILALLFLGGVIAGYFYYFQPRMGKTNPAIVPNKVRIANIADNKFSVSWTTTEETIGEVEWGVVGEKVTNKARDDRDTNTKGSFSAHHVTIDGLQPSTQYAFRILSGPKLNRFDNKGSPYTATTGPVIGATPPSDNFYGVVQLPSKQAADGTIIYLSLPGSAVASTLVNGSGNYAFTLSTMRKEDLRSYIEFDPSATVASLTVESGTKSSIATVSLANSAPVPTITLGQNADFLSQTPSIAQVEPTAEPEQLPSPTPTPEPSGAQPASIFNVEPLTPSIDQVSTTTVTLLNPKEVGEVLATLRPEFRGKGPAGLTLNIALTGQKSVTDTTKVAADGNWTWAPVIDLRTGKQKITITYTPVGGTKQTLSREFTISNNPTGLDPAFVSTPSASIKASPSPTPTPTPVAEEEEIATPTPRAAMPATDSGIPVTGVIENTLLTGALGIVIMIVGGLLLSL